MPKIKKRKYMNPPIIEALCEIYFKGNKWDQTIPGLFFDKINTEFPNKSELKNINVQVQIKDGGSEATTTEAGRRIRFSSADNSKMVQVGENLLVVNQLQPYPESFELWKPRIFEMLKIYREIAQPSSIFRIGMRFINRVTVPEEQFPVEKYFRTYPQISPELAGFHGDFLMRLKVPASVKGHELLLTLSTTPKDQDNKAALLLDIYDILQMAGSGTFDAAKNVVSDCHANIEHAFEQSITEAARELFGVVP